MSSGPHNLLVFRENRRRVGGMELKSALLRLLGGLRQHSALEQVLDPLLRAGELECAVADAGSVLMQPYMAVTDRLAEGLLAPDFMADSRALQAAVAAAPISEVVETSPPEGFAYYALHPLSYSAMLPRIPALGNRIAITGIRTIGATLSAVVAAAARLHGIVAERITVRPQGHPYNRETRLSPDQVEFVREHAAGKSSFVVVDEGPGLSGSSLLSVAEALERAGAPRERITLICGHEPDFDLLRADDAPRRARRFRWIAPRFLPRRPDGAEVFIGTGQWRRHLLVEEADWPASWMNLERLKYLSAEKGGSRRLFKFFGLGHYGAQASLRELQTAAAGFGPELRGENEGFVSYPWISGRPMSATSVSEPVLLRLAEYCAFRVKAFAFDVPDLGAIEEMAQHNARELGVGKPPTLQLERPVLADGRMQPHEWVRSADGRLWKTDSGSHGDDHFFPGATDIAWDLAGTIVEWNMSPSQTTAFLENYRRASGDNARPRLPGFIAAYTLFRCAYCKMAASALPGSDEAVRLERTAERYQSLVARAAA